jgi:cell wall-associated NlpC family hydrolase
LDYKYPWYTPYQFAGNTPICSIDIDGLEPDKILNEGERLLNTPYEFGGKNPAPEVIGMLSTDKGRAYWKKYMIPLLQLLYTYHPIAYTGIKDCTEKQKDEDLNIMRAAIYKVFPEVSKHGSLGIDCSGFVYKCFKQDKTLLMTINWNFIMV